MSYLDSLRVFVRVVEKGSITAGGRDMRLSPAGASNRIKELENRFGVRLLNRTTRSLTTTEIGQLLYDRARAIIEAVDAADALVASHSGSPQGVIRVVAPLGVGRRLIAPLIPRFCERWPEVQVRLRLTDRGVNLIEDAADVAFFLGEPEDSTFAWRRIAECARVLVASPGYLAAHGTPREPDDLMVHNCLLLRFPRSPEYFWVLDTPEGRAKLAVTGRFDADAGDVLTAWALDGAGIANRPRYEVAAHLADGSLVELLPDTPPVPVQFGALLPHRQLQDPKVRLFVDFAVQELKGAL